MILDYCTLNNTVVRGSTQTVSKYKDCRVNHLVVLQNHALFPCNATTVCYLCSLFAINCEITLKVMKLCFYITSFWLNQNLNFRINQLKRLIFIYSLSNLSTILGLRLGWAAGSHAVVPYMVQHCHAGICWPLCKQYCPDGRNCCSKISTYLCKLLILKVFIQPHSLTDAQLNADKMSRVRSSSRFGKRIWLAQQSVNSSWAHTLMSSP